MDDIRAMLESQRARDLVCETCLHLNAGRWSDFLALCEPAAFKYSIVNFSPEIKKTQCWMKQDFAGLAKLLDLLPKHNSDRAQLTRHVTTYKTGRSSAPDTVSVVSHVTIFRTEWDAEDSHLQSGATSLYVVGKYVDEVVLKPSGAYLASRTVDLDTRQVGIGSHYIL